MKAHIFFSLITVVLLTACQNKIKTPPLIELEDFFRNPEKAYFAISPDGKHISYTAPWKNRMNIFIEEIGQDIPTQITFESERDVAGYIWANNQRILYVKDEGGNEDYKLFGVDISGGNQKCLTCFPGVKTSLIDELEDNPEEVIIGLNKRNPEVFDPYRLNIATGQLELLAENPGNIIGWITDHNGKLRAAYAITGGVNTTLLYRESENQAFREILTAGWRDTFFPLFFTFNNKKLYASSNLGRDKAEIVIFDPETGEETETIFKHSEVDVHSLIYSKKRKTLLAASYTTDKSNYHFFDELAKKRHEILQSKLPGYEISITSTDKSEEKFIIRTYSDRSCGRYYFYDQESEELTKIADICSWLNEEHLSEMRPITYTSRDGLTIHGYLTLPNGYKHKNLSLIVNPHGGPWARDKWGYNPEVQFLANRGYAVLQMNFRGSTGYGKEFWLKSMKQWGRAMQDDISDGANWLMEQGIADPDRIAIYGASYGGYATLAGLAFTPNLYACGVDYVGISNLFTFMETIPAYWEPMRERMYELIGNPVADSLLLTEVSPALQAHRITSPVLIAQGANDSRVNISESDQMVKAMRERGVEVEYMVKEDEGHGFQNEENRFDFYRAMENFLANHIGNSLETK